MSQCSLSVLGHFVALAENMSSLRPFSQKFPLRTSTGPPPLHRHTNVEYLQTPLKSILAYTFKMFKSLKCVLFLTVFSSDSGIGRVTATDEGFPCTSYFYGGDRMRVISSVLTGRPLLRTTSRGRVHAKLLFSEGLKLWKHLVMSGLLL